MTETRRDFLKFVVAGSVASGCPIDPSLLAADRRANADVDGDHFEICHQIRDGRTFPEQPVAKRYEVVIVGGGVSGLSAAYFLRDRDFLILEKEPHWGGNAYREEFQGQGFATGSAFDEKGSVSQQLAQEIGLTLLPIDCPDPSILAGQWIADLWRSGLDQLPYGAPVRESFKKFRADFLKLDTEKDSLLLDSLPLSHYLKGHAPEIKQWWDAYGPSNWGAASEDTSAYVAADDFKYLNSAQDPRMTLPGGNGAFSAKLALTLRAKHGEQMISDATIVGVTQQKTEVHITYSSAGTLRTVAAKYVVMATPKFITARLVAGLPDAQREAMLSFRYCPYPVINMIFDKSVYNRAYDTWCPGNSFSDFIVADWVLQKRGGYVQKNNILTFYTPLDEARRATLLSVDSCQRLATQVLADFRKLQPEFDAALPIEVHFYRRGHPMFVPTPGTFTKTIPIANQPLDRVYFANTDSVGPISEVSGAVEAAQKASEWIQKQTASTSANRTTAEQTSQ
jgi:monoamine oxidase